MSSTPRNEAASVARCAEGAHEREHSESVDTSEQHHSDTPMVDELDRDSVERWKRVGAKVRKTRPSILERAQQIAKERVERMRW